MAIMKKIIVIILIEMTIEIIVTDINILKNYELTLTKKAPLYQETPNNLENLATLIMIIVEIIASTLRTMSTNHITKVVSQKKCTIINEIQEIIFIMKEKDIILISHYMMISQEVINLFIILDYKYDNRDHEKYGNQYDNYHRNSKFSKYNDDKSTDYKANNTEYQSQKRYYNDTRYNNKNYYNKGSYTENKGSSSNLSNSNINNDTNTSGYINYSNFKNNMNNKGHYQNYSNYNNNYNNNYKHRNNYHNNSNPNSYYKSNQFNYNRPRQHYDYYDNDNKNKTVSSHSEEKEVSQKQDNKLSNQNNLNNIDQLTNSNNINNINMDIEHTEKESFPDNNCNLERDSQNKSLDKKSDN